jgi:predicted transcriptional regulator
MLSNMNPRPVTQREQDLIRFYIHCQLGITPKEFYAKWQVSQETLAQICSRSLSTVQRWLSEGSNYRRPTPSDMRHLALLDFLLENFEEIPQELRKKLGFPETFPERISDYTTNQ